MPANTAMPLAERISAPAPIDSASGTTPIMKAIDVIRIGRSLNRPLATRDHVVGCGKCPRLLSEGNSNLAG
jgi:hypothetical protein